MKNVKEVYRTDSEILFFHNNSSTNEVISHSDEIHQQFSMWTKPFLQVGLYYALEGPSWNQDTDISLFCPY